MVKEMIDLEEAKRIFDQYLDDYDRTDDKIHLKIAHTYCVLKAADEICRGKGLEKRITSWLC